MLENPTNEDIAKIIEMVRDRSVPRDRPKSNPWMANYFRMVSVLFVVVIYVVIGGVILVFRPSGPSIEQSLSDSVRRVSDRQSSLQVELDDIRKQFRDLAAKGGEISTSQQISLLEGQLVKIESKLQAIDDAIVENPNKALSIPMLRMDVEAIKKTCENDRIAVAKEIDRVYSLTQWFIGLFGTIAFGSLIPTFVSLYQSKRNGDDAKTKDDKGKDEKPESVDKIKQ